MNNLFIAHCSLPVSHCVIIFKIAVSIIFHMNLSSLSFPLLAIGLLCIALLIVNAIGNGVGAVSLAFAPVLIWAVVLALRGRG